MLALVHPPSGGLGMAVVTPNADAFTRTFALYLVVVCWMLAAPSTVNTLGVFAANEAEFNPILRIREPALIHNK